MIGCAVFIFVGSVIPIQVELSVSHLDKVVHLCQYWLFAWLLVQAIRTARLKEWEYLVLAWIYATSYGLLVEVIQGFLPWRSADLVDAAANALGAALGVWIGRRIPKRSSAIDRPQSAVKDL